MKKDAKTPLLKQYFSIKEKYKEEILFFRLGDFYEMFYEDAKIASKVLGLTLTSRNREKDNEVPLAGIPYHSANTYINKLVNEGYKVAVCEQIDDSTDVKNKIVKREVVRVVSKGTIVDIENLNEKSNNYIATIHLDNKNAYISYIDITTSEFKTLVTDILNVESILYRLDIVELVLTKSTSQKLEKYIRKENMQISIVNKPKKSFEFLCSYFNVTSLLSFGIDDENIAISCAMILEYVLETQMKSDVNLPKISLVKSDKYAEINMRASKNLEIFSTGIDKKTYGSLLWVLDKCMSSMGSRLLKEYLNYPLLDKIEIIKRQDEIDFLNKNMILRDDLREILKNTYDIERILSKITFGNENAKDLRAILVTLQNYLKIAKLWKDKFCSLDMKYVLDIIENIEKTIVENPPFSVRESGMIKPDFSDEVKLLNDIIHNGNKFLLNLEMKEKEKTGIKNLKIKYNKIFGYFIEVNKSNINLVPEEYIRKQTLANQERYITTELKEYEDKIINARAKLNDLEYNILKNLTESIKKYFPQLKELSSIIAHIDVICSFSFVSVNNRYIRPNFNDKNEITILNGRHPIVEKLVNESFIENDVFFTKDKNFIILTGPNMSGKSTYMKQIALICIMAQIGMYVPCKSANLSIVDKFLTRIGASDDILTGQSTFMVEMSEVSNILNSATKNSLIILDEVGRGTSTFDGLSIASSISKYIHDNIGAKTIFATHYHELNELEDRYERMVNYRIEVEEKNHRIIFLRKISKGSADKSYGNYVAKLAGLPTSILIESKKLLSKLEKRHILIQKTENIGQLSLFDNDKYLESNNNEQVLEDLKSLKSEIDDIDINSMTPLKALNMLQSLKEYSEKINIEK